MIFNKIIFSTAAILYQIAAFPHGIDAILHQAAAFRQGTDAIPYGNAALPFRIYTTWYGIAAATYRIAALPYIIEAFPYQTAAVFTTADAKASVFCAVLLHILKIREETFWRKNVSTSVKVCLLLIWFGLLF